MRAGGPDGREMAAVLRACREEILSRWEAGVRQLPRARNLTRPEVRDDVPDLLDRIALLLEAGDEPTAPATAEETREHALHRLAQGFDAAQVVAELGLLRRTILDVWGERWPLDLRVVLAIGRAIDDATAASVAAFSRARQEAAEERERALREREAENARLAEQAVDEAARRRRVLAIVSHDLRNPLSAVLMSASRVVALAGPGEQGERVRRAGETIRRAAERMNRLIDDLLDVAAIEAGRLSVSPSPQDPAALLHEAAEAFRPAAREKGLSVEVEVPAGLPPVLADRDRVLQVLSNLLGNAVKVTERGGLRLSARVEGAAAVLAVRDTGPGIAPEALPHLFAPYYRARDASYKGTGLGLSIARGIVEAHGGRISVESEPGAGATFELTLPLA